MPDIADSGNLPVTTVDIFEQMLQQESPEGAFFFLPQEISQDEFVVISRMLNIDQDKLAIAMGFAREVHSDQVRDDGTRNHYTGHALLVPLYYAMIEVGAGRVVEEDVFLAGVMHDIKEDGLSFNDTYLTQVFGATVVDYLHAITKPPKSNYPDLTPPQLDIERESDYIAQFDGKGDGIRSLKCADKIANLRDDLANIRVTPKALAYTVEAERIFLPFAEEMILRRREYAMHLMHLIKVLQQKHAIALFGYQSSASSPQT